MKDMTLVQQMRKLSEDKETNDFLVEEMCSNTGKKTIQIVQCNEGWEWPWMDYVTR